MTPVRSESLAHNRILASVARDELGPVGLIRKGRSRTWLDDNRWWVGVVEFQPSGWSRGSYLNCGATWLWHDEHHLFFDLESRVQWRENGGWGEYIKYENDEQFTHDARQLARRAAEAVATLRRRLPTLEAAAREILRSDDGFWCYFDAAIAYAIAGDREAALRCFEKFAEVRAEYDWEEQALQRGAFLRDLLDRPRIFRAEVEQAIRRFRAALKLDPNVDIFDTCLSQ